MTKAIRAIVFSLFLIYTQITYGQSNKEKAFSKGQEAIKIMDEGKLEESIKLLEEARKLDPDKFEYPYEIAYARYAQKDYKEAIKILEKISTHPDVSDRFFQLLGNSYDNIGKGDKAVETYETGLKKFPNSGNLYLELGVIQIGKKDYSKALAYHEKGIEVAPKFPSNYYWATKIYCSSTEEVWGMIYGEIFMNLERNSKRTSEISKLLFDTYKSEIQFTNDSSMTVSFCQKMAMSVDDISDSKKIKIPFCLVYEPTLILSVATEKNIDINSLDRIRRNFIENYFKMGHNKTYPNVLFDYQKKVLDAAHLEAYNHWILMKGDEDLFDVWHLANKEKWDAFVKWFTDNGLKIDHSNKFYTGQY